MLVVFLSLFLLLLGQSSSKTLNINVLYDDGDLAAETNIGCQDQLSPDYDTISHYCTFRAAYTILGTAAHYSTSHTLHLRRQSIYTVNDPSLFDSSTRDNGYHLTIKGDDYYFALVHGHGALSTTANYATVEGSRMGGGDRFTDWQTGAYTLSLLYLKFVDFSGGVLYVR